MRGVKQRKGLNPSGDTLFCQCRAGFCAGNRARGGAIHPYYPYLYCCFIPGKELYQDRTSRIIDDAQVFQGLSTDGRILAFFTVVNGG